MNIPTSHDPRWITEGDVVKLINLPQAISALEEGLRSEANATARNMEKTATHWAATSNMHAIGAVFDHAGLFGTKTWGHTPVGSTPLMVVWDANTGKLRAIIEAMALGQMRTGGMSGVGTRWMSAPDADDLGVIGSGKQATTQVAAVAAVRKLRRIRVFSPTPAKRIAFAKKLTDLFPHISVSVMDDVPSTVKDASIITLITRATEAFLSADMVARGAHINAAGAITNERREFSQDVFSRAGLVAVDTVVAARKFSAEFIDRYDAPGQDWSSVQCISKLVLDGKPRSPDVDISLFKAMGMGIADLSLASEILRLAEQNGVGRPIAQPVQVAPRLTD